jgi:segregation and condensation protein B
MSLKAKLEAVIYAAEEPVTLAQLAALFAAEALEWKAAQEAASAETAGQEESAEEALPSLNAELDDAERVDSSMEQPGAEPAVATAEEPVVASVEEPAEPIPAAVSQDAEASADSANAVPPEPSPETAAEPVAQSPEEAEAEAKRLTRLRDRDVRTVLRDLLDELIATYASDDRGIEIKEIAGGFRMATKPECHDAARLFVKSLKPAMKLSLPALETLAVIAYKQPVTAPEVNEIRGVESSGVFGSLLARKLIATAGRKQVIGRPILYKTTKEFLLRFGLKDVTELPSMEEFEKMAQLEFEDMEPPAEVEPGSETGDSSVPEVDENPDQPEYETAATADRQEAPEPLTPGTPEPAADPSEAPAEQDSAEAAPAAPSSTPEQAETETVSHD